MRLKHFNSTGIIQVRLLGEFEDALADVSGHRARVEIQYVVLDGRLAEELKNEFSRGNLHFTAYSGRLCD